MHDKGFCLQKKLLQQPQKAFRKQSLFLVKSKPTLSQPKQFNESWGNYSSKVTGITKSPTQVVSSNEGISSGKGAQYSVGLRPRKDLERPWNQFSRICYQDGPQAGRLWQSWGITEKGHLLCAAMLQLTPALIQPALQNAPHQFGD